MKQNSIVTARFLSLLVFFLSLTTACNLLPSGLSPDSSADELISFLSDSLGIDSCVTGTVATPADLPGAAQAFIAQTYPNATVDEVLIYEVAGDSSYQVTLSSSELLLFNNQGQLMAGGLPGSIDYDDLDDKIEDFLEDYFDKYDIDDVELKWLPNGDTAIVVELDDDWELVFDKNGNTVCYELYCDDDDDCDFDYDDDYGDKDCVCAAKDSLPANVAVVLNADYPNYDIDEIICDSLCDGTQGYWLELEGKNGVDPDDLYLFFDEAGTFLIEAMEIDEDDVPSLVLNAAQQQYPGDEVDDDAYQWEYANGAIAYLLEVEKDNGSDDDDWYALFDDAGNFLCEREEDDYYDGCDDDDDDD